MAAAYHAPYLGVAYYPEDWDVSEIDSDIAKMKEAGINTARIGEFAWYKMEPEPGRYEFGWLHDVVDRLGAAGIAVVMGTPSATPPRWLSKLYPDIMQSDENGIRKQHGGRRHCCSNNPHYREYSARIARKLGEEFGRDEHIIGWQIDNEIYTDVGCFCPNCVGKFAEYLREKYGNIDNLNRAWNLNLFSQAYDSFADIPTPARAWVNPHHKMEWKIFHNSCHIDFVHMQADILRPLTDAPIGTDTMPFRRMDYRHMTEKLDIVQFNHYNTEANLWNAAMWMDHLRTLKDRPFWVTETATCWNGSVDINQDLKPEGFCRANSWMPLALGGEANMYWLWRTHWAGHELTHGSVLSSSGRPMHIFHEVQRLSREYALAADFLQNTKVKTAAALHYSALNYNIAGEQSVLNTLTYDKAVSSFYCPMICQGLRPDMIDARQPLDSYKLIVSPMMMTLEEDDLAERMAKWVQDGGVWVVGPMSDIRTEIGTKYTDRPYGMLEKLCGVRWKYDIPDRKHYLHAVWKDGTPFGECDWYELFEADEDALVTVTDGYSSAEGLAPVIMKNIGKGAVIIVGALMSEENRRRILTLACERAGIRLPEVSGDSILVCPRAGEGREGVILVEHAGRGGTYRCEKPMLDLLSGKEYSGVITLAPYDVLVLE